MAARKNDLALRRTAVRMKRSGLGCTVIARELGIAKTTVLWYVRGAPSSRRRATNRVWFEESEAQSLARCERILAAEPRWMPDRVRCGYCNGQMDPRIPHHHEDTT